MTPLLSDTAVALAPAVPLVGRSAPLATVSDRLRAAPGLVTLGGAPGVGKSRLAASIVEAWGQPSCVVECADSTDPLAALGSALVLVPDSHDALLAQLGQVGPALIVLDNADRMIEGLRSLAEAVVAAAPELRLLVTSRQPLRIAREDFVRLAPLSTTQPEGDTEAWQLFSACLRARSVPVPERAGPELTALLTSLDGLPLAIELAAARWSMLGLRGFADRRGRLSDILADPRRPDRRQTSMRKTLEWSWSLLTPPQKRALAALSSFGGLFGLDAAEAVVGDDCLETLETLIEAGLVRVIEPGLFRLLNTLHGFAVARRLALPDADDIAHKQALATLEIAERSNNSSMVWRFEYAGDLERAMAHALGRRDLDLAVRIIQRMCELPHHRKDTVKQWGDRLRAASPPTAAWLLVYIRVLVRLGDFEGALDRARQARDIASDDRERANAIAAAAYIHLYTGRASEGVSLLVPALDQLDAATEPSLYGRCLYFLGVSYHEIGRAEAAGASFERALQIILGEEADRQPTGLISAIEIGLAWVQCERGDLSAARRIALEAVNRSAPASKAIWYIGALADYGFMLLVAGDVAEGCAALTRALEVFQSAFALVHLEAKIHMRLMYAQTLLGHPVEADACRRALQGMLPRCRDQISTHLAEFYLALSDRVTRDSGGVAALIQRAGDPGSRLGAFAAINAEARVLIASCRRQLEARGEGALVVHVDGLWFRCPDQPVVSLGRYKQARSILTRLTAAYHEQPGAPVDPGALVTVGWPGERISKDSAKNRLNVELSRLRKLGLRPYLQRAGGGYLLDPDVVVLRSDRGHD